MGEELGGASGAAVSELESERDQRERERVSQRVVKWAGVRHVSDLGHTANIFFLFFVFTFIFAVCHSSWHTANM